MQTTQAKVERALKNLGSTVGEIERTLVEGGFSGEPGCLGSCPVANYLQAKLKREDVRVYDYIEASPIKIETPPEVVNFISRFDTLKANKALYPDSPVWTPPIDGYQYRLKYSKDGFATCPAAKEDGYEITRFDKISAWRFSDGLRVSYRAKLSEAVKKAGY